MKYWWDILNEIGPASGYVPNASKMQLLVKEKQVCPESFSKTGVHITAERHCLLGAPIGTSQFCNNFLVDKVTTWKEQLEVLALVACMEHLHTNLLANGLSWEGRLKLHNVISSPWRTLLAASLFLTCRRRSQRSAGYLPARVALVLLIHQQH